MRKTVTLPNPLPLALCALLLFSLALLVPAKAQVNGSDAAEINRIIAAQLAAFNADDGNEAFSYASPNIRAMFGSADVFMAMVQQGYPQVYRSQQAEFLEITVVAGRLVQPVLITDSSGGLTIADYIMEQQADGSWRIDGCVLRQPEDAAV